MRSIAIFVALRWEGVPILRQLHQVRRTRIAAFPAWRGTAAGLDMCVIRTGVGLVRAGEAAAAAGAAAQFDLFVSSGCAGALASELQPGDLAVATTVIARENGERFETDLVCRGRAQAAAQRAGLHATLGPVLSSPAALATVEAKQTAAVETGAVAVEMEAAAIAAGARALGVPFACVRAILDSASTELHDSGIFVDPQSGTVRPLSLLRHLARHPGTVTQLWEMQRMMVAAQRSLGGFFTSFLGRDDENVAQVIADLRKSGILK